MEKGLLAGCIASVCKRLRSSRIYFFIQPGFNSSVSLNSVFVRNLLVIVFVIASFPAVHAQTTAAQPSDDYKKAITDRSAKIVNVLNLTDAVKYAKVQETVMNQYFGLNKIHDDNKAAVAAIQKQGLSKEDTEKAIKELTNKKSASLTQLHNEFIAHLKEQLTEDQIDQVKDGMTYRVFPITYAAYQDMIPALTITQKDQIYSWLKEARELAMDEGSSDDKHKVFGKYKGRINNFLSAAGYDMKKEGEEWQKRIKEKQKTGQ